MGLRNKKSWERERADLRTPLELLKERRGEIEWIEESRNKQSLGLSVVYIEEFWCSLLSL